MRWCTGVSHLYPASKFFFNLLISWLIECWQTKLPRFDNISLGHTYWRKSLNEEASQMLLSCHNMFDNYNLWQNNEKSKYKEHLYQQFPNCHFRISHRNSQGLEIFSKTRLFCPLLTHYSHSPHSKQLLFSSYQ